MNTNELYTWWRQQYAYFRHLQYEYETQYLWYYYDL